MQSTHELQAERLVQPAQEVGKHEDTTHTAQMAPLTREYQPHDAQAPNAFTRQQAQFLNPAPQGKRGQ